MSNINKIKEERENRRNLFLNWKIEEDLPQTVHEYSLKRVDVQDDRKYYAFSYVNEKNGWEVKALFDEETMDFMIKADFRLFVITQIEMITGDFEKFKNIVKTMLPEFIYKEMIDRSKVSVLVKSTGFTKWDYSKAMPETIHNYKRVIEPSMPVLGLNGSYIVAAYECRQNNSGILFFYNMYRNQYYGEMRAGGIPKIIHKYDATTLKEFEQKIIKNLKEDLHNLYLNPVSEE